MPYNARRHRRVAGVMGVRWCARVLDVSDQNSELAKKVAATANRLRLVQMDFADDDEDTRQEQLAEEVERALATIIPEQRREFLEMLRDRFPSWDANVRLADSASADGQAGAAPTQSATDMKELKDASFLVNRLIEVSRALPEQERQAVVSALSRAGLAPAAGGGAEVSEAVLDEVGSRLQLSGQQRADAERVAELAALMGEVLGSLDQVVWNTWRMLSPKATIRRPAPLPRTMGRYAAGDPEIGKAQVKQELEQLRKLTAALISAVSQAGRAFAQRHSDRFSPAAIEALAKMAPGGLLVSNEVKCWRKYVELAGPMDAATIEAEFLQAISTFAESLMKGTGR